MTALPEFERLESPGVWRTGPEAQRRDVVVSFGDATLILSDAAGRPLTHWSLAATKRIGGTAEAAVFSPDPDGRETLELTETLMIDAIERIERSVARKRPHPGALRGLIAGTLVAGVLGLAYFWLPGALITQANTALPTSGLQRIDTGLTQALAEITGPTCNTSRGNRGTRSLQERIKHPAPIMVVPEPLPQPLLLPGGTLIIDNARLTRAQEPAEIAGQLVATRTTDTPPLTKVLEHVGIMGTIHLLTTGRLRDTDLRKAARGLVSAAPAPKSIQSLVSAFAQAEIPAGPWASGAGLTGQSVVQQISDEGSYPPVLADRDWIGLQTICGF